MSGNVTFIGAWTMMRMSEENTVMSSDLNASVFRNKTFRFYVKHLAIPNEFPC